MIRPGPPRHGRNERPDGSTAYGPGVLSLSSRPSHGLAAITEGHRPGLVPQRGSQVTTPASEVEAAATHAPHAPAAVGSPRTVLVVDDVAETRELLRWQLGTDPDLHVVGEATDGDDALAQVSRLRPDIVILALMMPVRGGLDTIPRLRQLAPACCVVAITSCDSFTAMTTALELGATSYVVKGTRRAEFVRRVRHAAGLEQ